MLLKKLNGLLPIFCLLLALLLASCTAEPAVPATSIPPTEAAPAEVVPTEVPATEAAPAEVVPTEVPATEVPPTSTPEPEPEAAESTERVEIPVAGFSVIPPAGYTLNLDDPEGIQMLAEGALEEVGPFIGIFGGAFGEEMTADQMYEFIVAADETLGEVERLPYENPDGDGFIAEFTTTEGDVTINGRLALTLTNGQGTLVTAIAQADEWDAGFREILDAVQESIEMFPPAE